MPSNLTNAVLAQKISDLIDTWNGREDEFQAWLSGVVDGGDFLNGTYPLTSQDGTVRYTKAPAQLEDDVSGLVDSAETHAANASSAAASSDTSAAAAAASATSAASSRDLSLSYKDAAAASASASQNSAVNSAASAVNADASADAAAASAASITDEEANAIAAALEAEHWANNAENVLVQEGDLVDDYSAKHFSIKAAASAAAAATFDPDLFAELSTVNTFAEDITFAKDIILSGTKVIDGNGSITIDVGAGALFVNSSNATKLRLNRSASEAMLMGFYDELGAKMSDIGHIETSGNDFFIRNLLHGTNMILRGEDASGVTRDFLLGDPDTGVVSLYHLGAESFRTASRTATDKGTGAEVLDGTGTMQPVGMNVQTIRSTNSAYTFALADVGRIIYHTTGSDTWTVPDTAVIPAGATWTLLVHAGTVTLAQGAGATLRWQHGAGFTDGNRTMTTGGVATIVKHTDGLYQIWGNSGLA